MKGSNSCASHKPQGLSSPGLLLNCFSQPCASILCLQGAAWGLFAWLHPASEFLVLPPGTTKPRPSQGPALWSSSATCRRSGSLQPVAREGGRGRVGELGGGGGRGGGAGPREQEAQLGTGPLLPGLGLQGGPQGPAGRPSKGRGAAQQSPPPNSNRLEPNLQPFPQAAARGQGTSVGLLPGPQGREHTFKCACAHTSTLRPKHAHTCTLSHTHTHTHPSRVSSADSADCLLGVTFPSSKRKPV